MNRGTRTVTLPPFAGPAIDTSGAGEGGLAPAGHGVNAPDWSTCPSRPPGRMSVPRTYKWTASDRPLWLVIVSGSRSGPPAAAGVAAASDAVVTSTANALDHLVGVRMVTPRCRGWSRPPGRFQGGRAVDA